MKWFVTDALNHGRVERLKWVRKNRGLVARFLYGNVCLHCRKPLVNGAPMWGAFYAHTVMCGGCGEAHWNDFAPVGLAGETPP